MQTVTDNDRFCITIPTIKQRDLGGYEKITACKSYSYEDLKLSAPSITIPTIKRHDLGDYEEITTCKSCRDLHFIVISMKAQMWWGFSATDDRTLPVDPAKNTKKEYLSGQEPRYGAG